MSWNSPYSPQRKTNLHSFMVDGGRWTVDNSESRYRPSQFAQSPSRSILKTPNTPQRHGYSFQWKRNEQLNSRRVSFAKDARLRVYEESDSPDITSRGIPNLLEESQPADFNALNSPTSSNLFIPNSGSPAERKRRPDLFGSPGGSSKSPKRRVGGAPPSLLIEVQDDEDDSEVDLTRYLPAQSGFVRRNLFEDDNDEEEDTGSINPPVKETEDTIIAQETSPFRPSTASPRQFSDLSTPLRPTFASPRRGPFTPQRTSHTPQRGSFTPERASVTSQRASFTPERASITPQRASFSPERASVIPPRLTHTPQRALSTPPRAPFTPPRASITPQRAPITPQRFSNTPTRTTPTSSTLLYSPHRGSRYNEEETMQITQEDIQTRPTYREEETMQITQEVESPRRPHREEETMQITQEVAPSPVQSHRFASPRRTSFVLSTPLREENSVYSARRSHYLHDRSPLPQSRFNENNTIMFDSIGRDENDIMNEEYSQLYNTEHDINPEPLSMPLSEFLNYAGITFSDNVPAKDLRRRSSFQADYGVATDAEQALAAASLLPKLDLYQKSKQTLHELIHKSETVYSEIEAEISKANPQLIIQYVEGDLTVQKQTEQHLKEIKTYASLKSIQQWLTLWNEQLENLQVVLQENLDKLKQDAEHLPELTKKISPGLEQVKDYYNKSFVLLKDLEVLENEYDAMDHEKLKSLQEEMGYLRVAIHDFIQEAESLEQEQIELQEKDKALNKELASYEKAIKEAEATIEASRFVTIEELVEMKEAYEQNCEIGGWELRKPEYDIVHMRLERNIDVTINQTKLENRQLDAVEVRMVESTERLVGPLAELFDGISASVRDKWEVDEIMQDIAIYWNRVMMIQRDLRAIQRRFWVQIDSLRNESNPMDAGFTCQICVHSFNARTKYTIQFTVTSRDVLNYPTINTDSLSLVIHFSHIAHEELIEIIKKEFEDNGFNEIVETLTSVSERIAIPT